MKRSEFRGHLIDEQPDGNFEALVSIDTSQLLESFTGDKVAFTKNCEHQLETVANKIRAAFIDGPEMDVFPSSGQIMVKADLNQWMQVLEAIASAEYKNGIDTNIFPNHRVTISR
ncbi:hypothetical protein [Roseibium aggregatum]|uniref:Uncharacterized protein n=1 Tax=Roseibium aggregatum TaxID=187304 RepID=A0A939EIQ2_9HYPH|nr:hypothetical protein [Roseibium aggregatum]MBN9673132.1 hypothetical protein [Roseibium aggregatum]